MLFSGVMTLIASAPESGFVMPHCYGRHTTNISSDVVRDHEVFLADRHDGKDLAPGHGAPVRLVVPKRYPWEATRRRRSDCTTGLGDCERQSRRWFDL